MNRTLPVLAVLCLVSVLVVTNNASGASPSWSIETDPPFCYIGDNVTIEVRGTPMSYATIIVIPANGTVDESIGEELVQLDFLGNADCNISVSVDTPGGPYRAMVVYDSVERANTTFEVLFDYQIYDTWLTANLIEDLDEQKALTREYARETARLADAQEQTKLFALGTFLFALASFVYVWKNRDSWRMWNLSMIKQAKNFKDQIKQYWAMIALPRPDGEQTLLHDGMKAKMEKMRKELSPYEENIERIRVIVPDRASAQGFRIHEVVSEETATKEIETAPNEVVEIVPEPKRKERFRRGPAHVKEEVSVTEEIKVKPLEEKRGFHFPSLFGRRKDVVPMNDEDLYPGLERERPPPIERPPAVVVEPKPARAPAKKSSKGKSAPKTSSASRTSSGKPRTSKPRKKPAPKPKTEEVEVQ